MHEDVMVAEEKTLEGLAESEVAVLSLRDRLPRDKSAGDADLIEFIDDIAGEEERVPIPPMMPILRASSSCVG